MTASQTFIIGGVYTSKSTLILKTLTTDRFKISFTPVLSAISSSASEMVSMSSAIKVNQTS